CLGGFYRMPGDVEAVGVLVHARIPVGAADEGDDGRSGGDLRAVEVDRLGGVARPGEQGGAAMAQHLVDGCGKKVPFRLQHLPLLRVVEQSLGAIADQMRGGFVPGDDQGEDQGDEFTLGETVAVLVTCVDQGSQEVVVVCCAALVDHLFGVLDRKGQGVVDLGRVGAV